MLLETTDRRATDALEESVQRYRRAGITIEVVQEPDAANLDKEYAEEAMTADAVIVTPVDHLHRRRRVTHAGIFTVEVQADPVRKVLRDSWGADAELFGLGPSGYAMALDLIAARAGL